MRSGARSASPSATSIARAASRPSGRGAVMWYASLLEPNPRISATTGAPRPSAASRSSSTRMAAASPITKPSRSRSNGRDARGGIVVADGEDADEREGAEREGRQRRLRTAGQRDVDRAVPNGVKGLADGHRPGRARVRVAHCRPGQAEVERHVAGARAAEHRERQRRRHPAHAARHEAGVLLLAERHAAERRADPDPGSRRLPVADR